MTEEITTPVEGQTNTEATTDVTPETTPEVGNTLLGSDPAAPEVKPEVQAPESYEAFKMPEGITIDDGMLDKFTTLAKDNGFSQEKAQGIIDLANDHVSGMEAKRLGEMNTKRESWVSSLKSDVDFGGEKLGKTIEGAQRVLGKYGSDDLKKELNASGLGDNHELIKLLARVDRATREDKLVEGAAPLGGPRSAEEVLYPSSN